MYINLFVLIISLSLIIFDVVKIIKLKKFSKEEGEVIDFEEQYSKRYVYFIPILKIKDKEIKWKKNPKLEKSLLNKKIKLLIKEEEIFEKSYLIKLFVYISISFGFLIFSIINLKNMFL